MYCFIIYIILQLVIENLLSSGENMAKKSFYKIEMLFLKILEKEDCYGYQLTQSIQDITNGQIKIAEGTMYPILYKLQDQGYISDRQVKVGKRQTRVYYHLEPAGKEYLSQLTHDYYQMVNYPSHAVQWLLWKCFLTVVTVTHF